MRERLYRLLRWSEKYLKTDMVYLAQGGFWLTLGQIIHSATAFVLALALANLLPKTVYGTFKYVLSIASLFSIFTLPGMTTALSRASARGYGGSLLPTMYQRMRVSLIGSALGLAGAAYYYHAGQISLAISLLLISIFLPFFDPLATFSGYLTGTKQFKQSTYITLILQVVSMLAMIAAAFVTENLLILLLAYFVPLLLIRAFFTYKISRCIAQPVDPGVRHYGFHLSAMNVLSQIASQADDIILFHFVGPASVAIYSVAIAPAEQVRGFFSAISTLLFPRLAEHSERSAQAGLLRKMILSFLGLVGLLMIYQVLVSPFFHIFFPKYIEAIPYSQLFALSLLYLAATPASTFLQAHAKVKEQYGLNIISSLLQIGSMALGAAYFGLWGLVVARIATRYFGAMLSIMFAYLTRATPL